MTDLVQKLREEVILLSPSGGHHDPHFRLGFLSGFSQAIEKILEVLETFKDTP